MQESLWRCWWWWWWWLLWACLVAGAMVVATDPGQGQCEVLDLSLQPTVYRLPTNLTLRPSVTGWQLNFTLQEGQTAPVACLRLKEETAKVQVLLYEKDCVNGTVKTYNYLDRALVPPHTWTSLALHVEGSAVVITPPQGPAISVKASRILAHHGLQVTLAQDVEAAVGCSVTCPLHIHALQRPNVKKKVQEWRQAKLHFYFLPGPSFRSLHYNVSCSGQPNGFSREVAISPGQGAAMGNWHQVQLEQQNNRAEVFLNSRLLEEILLPDSCPATMHVIWTVGDASFGFNCVPEAVEQRDQRVSGAAAPTATPAPPGMGEGVGVGIAVGVLLCLLIVAIVLAIRHRCCSSPHANQPLRCTGLPHTNGCATPPGTQPTQDPQPTHPTQGPAATQATQAAQHTQEPHDPQNRAAPRSREGRQPDTHTNATDALHTPPPHSQAPQTSTQTTVTDGSQAEETLHPRQCTTASQTDTPDTARPRSEKASQTEKLTGVPHTGPQGSPASHRHTHPVVQAGSDKPQHTYPWSRPARGTQGRVARHHTWTSGVRVAHPSIFTLTERLGSDEDKQAVTSPGDSRVPQTVLSITQPWRMLKRRSLGEPGGKGAANPEEECLLGAAGAGTQPGPARRCRRRSSANEQTISEDSTEEV